MAAIWGAAISAVVGYAASKSKESAAKKQQKQEFEAAKKLLEQQRGYDLEDRKYRQDAANSWAKFANPQMIPNGQPVRQQMPPAPYNPGQYSQNPYLGMNPYDQQ